jgi:predicted DNA-binding transcriptional regulator AlpA
MTAALSDRWLTPIELAEMFTIPIETLYQWRYRKCGPPSHKIGRHIRYRLTEVDAWAASQ